MLARFPVLSAVLLGFTACGNSHEPPRAFSAMISNTFHHTYIVELRDGAVVYYKDKVERKAPSIKIVPSKREWGRFRAALDKTTVWHWHSGSEYYEPVTDGTIWNLKIDYPDRHVETSGSNGYPKDFAEVTRAIEQLIGGQPFRVDEP